MKKQIIFFITFFVLLPVTVLASNNLNIYKNLVKQLVPPNTQFSVVEINKYHINGYKTFDVIIKNRATGTKIHNYVWISSDKKMVIPVILVSENGHLVRLMPENRVSYSPVDVGWFLKYVKDLPKDLNKTYGNGKSIVYLLSDPYCPFCKEEMKILDKMVKDDKITLHILPFDIHGKKSVLASILFWHIESTTNLKKAIDEIEGADFNSVTKNVNNNIDTIESLKSQYEPLINTLAKLLSEHNIDATPTMIIVKSKNKALIVQGVTDLSKEIR